MHQPMRGGGFQVRGEREHNANLVVERVILAIHDLATRQGATRAKVMKALKAEGFTPAEIAEATRRMLNDITAKEPKA